MADPAKTPPQPQCLVPFLERKERSADKIKRHSEIKKRSTRKAFLLNKLAGLFPYFP